MTTLFSAGVGTGTRGGALNISGTLISQNAAANTSTVRFQSSLSNINTATFVNNATGCALSGSGGVSISSTFTWASGTTSKTLIDSTVVIAHNPDGTFSGGWAASINATGTTGIGGPTNTGTQSATFPRLTVLPGVPSGVSASRVSDSSVSLSWSQSSASNGAPTSNTIRRRINGGAFSDVVTIGVASSASLSAAANQKIEFGVRADNAAGTSGYSATSAAIYTTPAAPTNASAVKTAGSNIVVSWVPNVAFVEHQHVVRRGTVSNGVITYESTPLGVVAAGVSTITHTSPNLSQVHVYAVSARNTSTGALQSSESVSNSVQLLTAPNAPTLAALPANANRQAAFVLTWAHNPVDTTAQTAFEVNFSLNGGSTWTSTGKVTSGVSSRTITANTYTGNQAVTVRVRTWGAATSGGSDGTGASVYSTSNTVTFKTLPTVTIVAPANAVNYAVATLNVQLNFAQAEGATFVSAQIELLQGVTVLELIASTTIASTVLTTAVDNGQSYSVRVSVTDSNGLTSTLATRSFNVVYTLPVTAGVTLAYLPSSGIVQLGLTFPTAGGGLVAATTVTVLRTIGGRVETVANRFPITAGTLTILDTTPTINGVNGYTVRTFSNDGATSDVGATITNDEGDLAFLSSGVGFADIVKFQSNLRVAATGAREQELVRAAGRVSPIALFGPAKSLQVSGSATLFAGDESTPQDVEAFIRAAGVCCYRDGTGRRMFGIVAGSIETVSARQSELQFTVTEAT